MYIVKLFLLASLLSAASEPAASPSGDLFSTICTKSYMPRGQPRVGVSSPVSEGSSWPEMNAMCGAKHPGYALAQPSEDFAAAARQLCPDESVVPVIPAKVFHSIPFLQNNVLQYKLTSDIPDAEDEAVTHAYRALNVSTSETISVGEDVKFRCGVCQMMDRDDVLTKGVYPPHNNSIYSYDLELVSNKQIKDIGVVANGSALVNNLLGELAEAFNISVDALRWHGAKLNEDQKAVVHVYYDLGDGNKSWFYYEHWNDVYFSGKSVGSFQITMIKLSTECTRNITDLVNYKRFYPTTGEVNIMLDVVKGTLNTRECYWDDTPGVEAAVWSPTINWWIVWGICETTPEYIVHMVSLQESTGLLEALNSKDVEAAFLVQFALNPQLSSLITIKSLVGMSNMLLVFHSADTTKTTIYTLMVYSLPSKMATLYLRMMPLETNPVQLHRSQYANVLIAVMEPVNPVVGMVMSLSADNGHIVTEATILSRHNMSVPLRESHIVVTVSDSITLSANCLHIAMYGAHLDKPGDPPLNSGMNSWMAVVVVAFTRNANATLGRSADDDFIDIAFKPAFRQETQRGNCAEWSEATGSWFVDNCRLLKSLRDEMVVCRCINMSQSTETSQKKDQQLEITGSYIIYGFDASLSTYLANNLTLIIVIVVVSALSAAGLLSIILTAICFPEWRKDQGHKIFMHMIFALTVNLVLGFVNNFFSIDTKSMACIVIGVVRHYSFLAMFVWMLTLSGLQLRRLTTIAGAKGTSHLILKVSLIAWGLPLIPIVVLLAWDKGFYKSEVSNRGYCYPEDVAFQATVQGPAGIILIANLVIFVFILNHIYGWVKCNKDVVVRKHTGNDRAEQLRRLCTTMFIFFLFGFTWLFHFLSEEGIINSEFLFEFLFLITAAFHLFMLALFLIVLDKNTREHWKNARFGCKYWCSI